ncbi:ATP synthase membrane subunit K, mitochondrial-like [Mauremys mutica]|uniref:ATP synthase membrane subunit K, mitochondrial-like n=1 Tax=Mauremys mutica TaxID=74926 RepID=UPI001D16C70F|nr:ATP synthase membrane subunit K, mitochondrial-like [Mauremys mutica]
MAGGDSGTQHKFTSIQKYFNSYTITGRIATYASIAMVILYFKLKPKKQTPAVTENSGCWSQPITLQIQLPKVPNENWDGARIPDSEPLCPGTLQHMFF